MLVTTPLLLVSLSAVSATTFAGGKGNDVIGTYTNFNNVWAAGTNSATWNNSDIEGGLGNDTNIER